MTTARSNLVPPFPPTPLLSLTKPWTAPGGGIRRAVRNIPPGGRDVLSAAEWTAVGLSLRLSPRELQIVHGVFDDLKESAIADNLGISAHTVHTHLERLYRKVGARGRTTMVVRIFAEHLRLISGMNPEASTAAL